MDLHANGYVYEVVPPYLNNQQLAVQMMTRELTKLKADPPDGATEAGLWDLARDTVLAGHGMVSFGVEAVSMPEADRLERECSLLYNDHMRDKAVELEAGKRLELVKKKLKFIRNLVLDGVPITTFDDFYAKAPKEMVAWLRTVIHSTIELSLSEIKNFLPE